MSAVGYSVWLGDPSLAEPWAQTTQGQILIPVIVACLLGLGAVLSRKIGKVLGGMAEVKAALAVSDVAQAEYRNEIRGRLDGVDTSIEAIKTEVKPNGGKSLKDTVSRIDAQLAAHLKSSEYQQQRLDSLFTSDGQRHREPAPDGP